MSVGETRVCYEYTCICWCVFTCIISASNICIRVKERCGLNYIHVHYPCKINSNVDTLGSVQYR